MALVEAVVGELRQKIEDLGGQVLLQAGLDRALHETVALGVHLGLDLLAHGAAQKVRFAERIARQRLRHLHHLFLVDDDAMRLGQEGLHAGMEIGRLLQPELAAAIGRDVVHRTGTVERHQRDQVLDPVGLHLDQRLAHADRFDLEHADRLAARQHLVGLGIVEGQLRQVDRNAALGDQLHRDGQRRQRLQAEEVELHQPGLLDPFHVELGDAHAGARIDRERDELLQRPVADDDAGGVGRGVAVQALELLRDLEQAPDHRLLRRRLLQLGLAGDRLRQRDRLGRVLRHQLGQLVDLAVGHLQHAADVAQHAARLQGAEGDDLGDALLAIAMLDVLDHLFAPVLAEVDVEVRHRDAVGIEEALEQQAEAQRVDVGDGQRIGDQRARARATARPDRDVLRLGPFDEVRDDQEVAWKFHPGDNRELEIEPLVIGLDRETLGRTVLGQPRREAGPRLRFELLGLVASLLPEARQDRLARADTPGAAPGDLDGRGQRLRQVGEAPLHLLAAGEEMRG